MNLLRHQDVSKVHMEDRQRWTYTTPVTMRQHMAHSWTHQSSANLVRVLNTITCRAFLAPRLFSASTSQKHEGMRALGTSTAWMRHSLYSLLVLVCMSISGTVFLNCKVDWSNHTALEFALHSRLGLSWEPQVVHGSLLQWLNTSVR